MFKPPKSSLLAALAVTVACKGGPDKNAVGDWAEEPIEQPKTEPTDAEPAKTEPHRVGKTAKPSPELEKIGEVAAPEPDDPKPH